MNCARCRKNTDTYSMLLWRKGPRGFRRYPICRMCERAIEAEKTPKVMINVERPMKEAK
jgi:hypothetical protein